MRVLRRPDQHHPPGAAADPEQSGRRQIVVVDEDARTEAEAADPAARLGRDHPADGEPRLPDGDLIADAQAQRRQQLRTDQRAVVAQQRV